MTKRFSWVFLLLSGLFFFFMVGLTGYRIENARQTNSAAALERYTELAAKARSLKDSTGGFDAPQFKTDMRILFDAEPRLLLLSIHSSDQGILYLVTRNKSYVKEPAEVSPDWRGTPVYQVSKGYELLVSRPVEDPEPTMDALFVIMGREDLYPVLRDDLYLFLAFLLVCAVIMLIASGIQDEPARPVTAAEPERMPRDTVAAVEPPRCPEPHQQAPPAASMPAVCPPPPVREPVSEPARPVAQRMPVAPERPPMEEPSPRATAQPQPAPASPRTDPAWLEYLQPRLESELSRAESSDLDLSLARLRLDEPNVDSRLPLVIAEVTRMIRESFPLHDMIFESGDDSCTILIPDTEIDVAVHTLDELRNRISAAVLEGKKRTVSIGVSSRAGRLIDGRTLLEEADVSLEKASREGGNQVIGFRADAARFRESLTGSRA